MEISFPGTNFGGYFDTTTGLYVAPTNGVYRSVVGRAAGRGAA